MKVKYKIYELVESDLLKDRSSMFGDKTRTILGEVENAPWNNFDSSEEALRWIEERKEFYKGMSLTIIPIVSVPCVEWEDDE